jgi:hypothetical protein
MADWEVESLEGVMLDALVPDLAFLVEAELSTEEPPL